MVCWYQNLTAYQKKTTNDSVIGLQLRIQEIHFFLCGETPADIETKLLKIKEKKQPIQPLVLIEGSILNIKNVFLYFDEVRYKFFFTIRSHKHLFQNFSCIPFRISVTFTPHVGFYSKIFI